MIAVRTILILVAGVVAPLTAIALLAACGENHESRDKVADSTPIFVRGKDVFRQNCAVCHGSNGEGQPDWHMRKPDGLLPAPPLNGDGHTWHHGDGTLYKIVSQGGAVYESPDLPNYKSGMPAFGETLSNGEIVAVITYVKDLWGDKIAQGLDLRKRESQAIVSETDPFPEPVR